MADLTAASMDTEDTINDSQMLSRDDSQYVEGGEEREGGDDDSDTDSSHSQETEGSGAEEEDMEENEEEEEEDDEDDDDGGSDAYDDEPDEFQDLEDAFFRMPGTGNTGNGGGQEHDNVMMIGHVNDDPLLEDRAISLPLWGDMAGGENGVNEGNGNGTVAGASGVAPSHPLLMGRSADALPTGSARAGARSLTRQRGFRYIQLNPRTGGTAPGTPAILQSLLGHNSGREFLQLTSGGHGLNVGSRHDMRDATRVLVMDQGFAILDSLEDEIPGLEGGLLGQAGGSALATVPNALVRWTEESRVLDGDSLHDCMTACKPDILSVVEKHRDAELNERREKKKKAAEEEEEKRKKEEEEKKKREPEASTTPAPESAGQSAGSGDEMDVVVSENAAASAAVSSVVEGLLAREEEDERREESLQNTATRLAEDLAQVISSRVTGMVGEEGRSSAPQYSFAGSAGGLLSSLQELLPTSQAQAVSSSGPASSSGSPPPASLSSVLQTLHSTYTQQQEAATAPTFQFATPPPPFPTVPVSPLEAPAPLPDALD